MIDILGRVQRPAGVLSDQSPGNAFITGGYSASYYSYMCIVSVRQPSCKIQGRVHDEVKKGELEAATNLPPDNFPTNMMSQVTDISDRALTYRRNKSRF